MIKGIKLTVEEKDSLVGKLDHQNSFYHPIKDVEDNWFISFQEIYNTNNHDTMWVKDKPLEWIRLKPAIPIN